MRRPLPLFVSSGPSAATAFGPGIGYNIDVPEMSERIGEGKAVS
jgi:hypothetical protein